MILYTKMKLSFVIITFTYLSAVQSDKIEPLYSFPQGEVLFLETDSNSSSYSIISFQGYRFFSVMDSNKDIMYMDRQNGSYFLGLGITEKDLPYLLIKEESGTDFCHIRVCHYIQGDGLKCKYLIDCPSNSQIYWFSDEEDNIFINSRTGVRILKTNFQITLLVANMENSFITNHAIDNSGNIYLNTESTVIGQTIFMIEKESKQTRTPYARILRGINDLYPIIEMKSDNKDHVFFGGKKFLQVLSDSSIDYIDEQFDLYKNIFPTDKRVFYITEHGLGLCELWYYDYASVVRLISDYIPGKLCNPLGVVDSKGSAYFGFGANGTGTFALSLKYYQNVLTRINIPTTSLFSTMLIDETDDLWILADDLYWVKNGNTNAVKIPGLPYYPDNYNMKMKMINDSNTILIGTSHGLYLYSKSDEK